MRKILSVFFIISIILSFCLLLKPALQGKLTGTFTTHIVPSDYEKLATILEDDTTFSRTLWVPVIHTYSYYSFAHPQISAAEFYQTTSLQEIIKNVRRNDEQNRLQMLGVQYVIVPYDSEKKIFLTQRSYDSALFSQTIQEIAKIPWLKRVSGFDQIAVFRLANYKNHFWILKKDGTTSNVSFTQHNPTDYTVRISHVSKGDVLIFSDSFDRYWYATDGTNKIEAQKYMNLINSFTFVKNGDYTIEVKYKPQEWVKLGSVVSIISLIILFGCTLILFGKQRHKW